MESCPASARPLRGDSLQMGELNRRLEAYLARVKGLEEENEALQAQVQRCKGGPAEASRRGRCEGAVAAWRAQLDQAFRERDAAERARAGLRQELQQVRGRCQQERGAREEARRRLASGRRELEEERRGHAWLRERAAQLEREAQALAQAHREDAARLEREAAGLAWGPPQPCRGPPAAFQPAEVEDYARRLAALWQGAVETYEAEVAQLEASLAQAQEKLREATESNRRSQLELQHLGRDLAGLGERKEALEERLARQWRHQRGEAQKLQVATAGLEEEKQALSAQIAQVLEERGQLMHLKMSLSLEVATYRTLLEAESIRLQTPAEHKPALGLPESKLEASESKRLPAVSLGSRDPKPSSTSFLKGGRTPQLAKKPSGPVSVSVVSVLPTSRSPVGQEFQRANTALQSQSAKAFEVLDLPSLVDSATFQLDSSREGDVVEAGEGGTVSRLFIHELGPLLSDSNRLLVPNVLGESSANAEQHDPPGEDGGEISSSLQSRERGQKADPQPREEPPWKPTPHNVPHPCQLVMEALEAALQGGRVGEALFEAGWLDAAETPDGIPPDDSSSTEEEKGAAALEKATLELHRMEDPRPAGLPAGAQGSEASSEANGGPEVCSEQQEAAAGLWGSRDAGPPSLHEAPLLEEERSPSAQKGKEEIPFDIPVTDQIDCCNERSASEQTEGGREEPPNVQGFGQREELEGGLEGAGSAEAAALWRGDRDSPELGVSCPEDHLSARGPDLEEADGGAEDLEVVNTEALHLSEDEERNTALSSPSRESEECDFQAEMLETESLQAEESAVKTLSPICHSFYFAESHQEHPFLGAEQKSPEEETSLSRTDSAWPEEAGKEVDLEPETSSAEEAVLREEPSAQALLAEPPRALEEEEVEEQAGAVEQLVWEPRQDILGHEGLLEEDGALGKEKIARLDLGRLQDWTWEQQTLLQQENVERVLRQETSTRDPGEETLEEYQEVELPREEQMEEEDRITTKRKQGEEKVEACQGDLSVEHQEVEEEEITTKGEQTVEVCQGDLPVQEQMEEEEEITTKGERIVEACQGDLPVEYQEVEEEEIATKVDQTIEVCQGDLPVENQEVEEEEITTKGEETIEVCQGDLPVEHQQVEEEEITTKGEETIEVCQEDLPVEHQQVEEEEITTKGEETIEVCQEDLPVEHQQVEEEEITTKGEETIEVCQEDLPMEHQEVEEEEITTKGEETIEVCQEDLPVEHQEVEEEEITTKGEETIEVCQEDLPVEHQEVEEEEITTKGEETIEVCQGDLPVEHQEVEEEEITTKGEETIEVCQGDMPVEHQQAEEEEITTKGEETIEVCQGDLPVEHQEVEEEEITTKGEETIEVCQGDLPVEHQEVEEEEITTTKREETVEECQGDLPVEHQKVEEEEITTKREETVQVCQGDLPVELQEVEEEEITTTNVEQTVQVCQGDLPVEHQEVEEEEITTKGEQNIEVCQGDLPVEHQEVEEEEITTKGEQTVEVHQRDLPMEHQQVEEEEITTKREETIEVCQEDLPVEHQQVEEEEITTKGERTVEVCQEDLPMEHQKVEEEEITIKGEETIEVSQEDLPMEHQQVEEEEITTKWEQTIEACQGHMPMEEQMDEEERFIAKGEQTIEVCQGDLPVAEQTEEEDRVTLASPERDMLEREDLMTESDAMETDKVESKTSLAEKVEAMGYVSSSDVQEGGNPEARPATETDTLQAEEQQVSVEGEETHQAQPSLCSEQSLPHRASQHIRLEDPLPDDTPLLLYGERMSLVPRKSQLLPEEGDAAEAPLLTKDGVPPAGAAGQAMEEAERPHSSQTENDAADGSVGVAEERGRCVESAPKQDSLDSEALPVPQDLEEAKTGRLELLRDHEEEGLPPLEAGRREQPGRLLSPGSGSREERACGDMTQEGTGRTGAVWETERDNVFPPDQPDPSYVPEGFQGGNEIPLEFSDPNNIVAESLHKVSPLTSVADLGEIVLEEEQSLDGQKDGLVYCEEERGPRVLESQPIPGLENWGQEEPTQQTDLPDLNSSGPDLAEAGLPVDRLRDSDILEIVEQALEFNQEITKAAEQTVEVEQWAAHPAESNGVSLALPGAGRAQVPPETPNAKDSTGSSHLWVENNGHGPQQESSLADFPVEILNGTGGLQSGKRGQDVGSVGEEMVGDADLDDLAPLEEPTGQSPPQTLAKEEAPRTGETRSETQGHRGQEEANVDKSPFAKRKVKGKDAGMEAVSVPPHFGEEILHRESSQHLKFRPEEEDELWSPEEN